MKQEGSFILDQSIPSMLDVLSPHFIFKTQTPVNTNNQGQDGPGLDPEGRACFPTASGNCQSSRTADWACGQLDQQQARVRRRKTTSRTTWSVCALVRSTGDKHLITRPEGPVPTLWQLLGMQLVQRKQCTRKTFFFSNGCWIYFLDQYRSWQKLVNQHWDICNEILILKTHDTLIEIRVYTNKKKSSICQQI